MCDLFSEKKLGDKTTSFSTKSKSLKGKTEILFNILKGTRFVCKDIRVKVPMDEKYQIYVYRKVKEFYQSEFAPLLSLFL